MTQEQIIALDSKKHIKIWLLHKQGLSRRQIADLLGTNPGHVGNEIKAYAVNKEKREAAEALTNTKDEKNGNKKGISIEEAISYIRAGAETAEGKQQIEIESQLAFNFAKEKKAWIGNISNLPAPTGYGGNENSLYYDSESGLIYKSNNLINHGLSVLNYLKYLLLQNSLFPNSKYTLVGFITPTEETEPNNLYIEPLVSQKFITGKKATSEQIEKYMVGAGFEKVDSETYKKGKYIVSDLKPRNVIKSNDGEIYVIDNIIREEKKSEESDYQKASKIPKGGTVNATPDNLSAWSAETIAKKHAMQPEAIYNWAKKHGVDLIKHGHILSKVESNSALLADVLNDKYEETKGLIESGATENKSFGDRMKEAREKKAQEKATMSPEELEKESFNKLLAKVDSLSGKEILKHFGLRDDQNMFGTAKRGTIFDRQYAYLSEDKYHVAALKSLYVLDKKMPLTIKLVSQKMVSSEQEHRYESGEDTESEYGVSKTSEFILDVFYKKTDFKVAALKNTSFSSEIKPFYDAYQLLKEYFRNKTLIATPIDFKTAEEVINNTINYKTESTAWRKNKVSEDDKKKAKVDLDHWYDESWKSIKERLKERGFKSSHQLFDENKAVLDNTYRAGILLSRTPLYKAYKMRINYEMERHPYNTVAGQIMASNPDIIAKYSEEAREQREKYRYGYDSQSFAAQKLAEDLNSVLDTNYTGNGYFYFGSMVGFRIYKGTKKFGDGGILEGPKHGSGGIKATLPDGNPIELEGGEIIINAKAAKEHCKELSKINQSTGNGVAFPCNNPALDGVQGPMMAYGGRVAAKNTENVKWFKDKEGRDRFEIDDSGADFDYDLLLALSKETSTKKIVKIIRVGEIFKNWNGYKHYPEVETLRVVFSPRYSEHDFIFAYEQMEDSIYINSNKIYYGSEKTNNRRGDNKTSNGNDGRGKDGMDEGASGSEYSAGRMDARSRFLHEIQHALQKREGIKVSVSDWNSMLWALKDKTGNGKMSDNEFIAFIEEKTGKPYKYYLHEYYMTLPSEIEAHDVQDRHVFTDKKRSEIKPLIMASEGAKIEAEHEDLYNELASLIPGGMPIAKEAFFEKIAKAHIKENPDYYKGKVDFSKKPYYLLTKEETIAERDRLEANNTDPQRLQDLCRYSCTKFKTLLKDLK